MVNAEDIHAVYTCNGLFAISGDPKSMVAAVSEEVRLRRGSHMEKLAEYIVGLINGNKLGRWPITSDEQLDEILKLDRKYYSSTINQMESSDAHFAQTLISKGCTKKLMDAIASGEGFQMEKLVESAIKLGPDAMWNLVLKYSEPCAGFALFLARLIVDQQNIQRAGEWEQFLMKIRRAARVTGDAEMEIVNEVIGRWTSSKCSVLSAVYQRSFHACATSLNDLNTLVLGCRAAKEPVLNTEAKLLVQDLKGKDTTLANLRSLSIKDNKVKPSTCLPTSSTSGTQMVMQVTTNNDYVHKVQQPDPQLCTHIQYSLCRCFGTN